MSVSSEEEAALRRRDAEATKPALDDAAVAFKHLTDQLWFPEVREDGVYLVGTDGRVILKLCRSDRGSDLLMAGYIMGLQARDILKRMP